MLHLILYTVSHQNCLDHRRNNLITLDLKFYELLHFIKCLIIECMLDKILRIICAIFQKYYYTQFTYLQILLRIN
ncbi:hypothetical protein EUGRSUZ_E03229 [Eucalyptus grandis]|uniref:Uncharacterized protein n=2 Tax=Eucalyptus grandis TaxID=71139 RepID=A0ACC3KY91_EUCGR|nr:hypothetical protein EUGRSUZ_E03229 [Eucalyptus grandis]